LIAVFCAVSGAALEELMVLLNIRSEVYNFTSVKLSGGIQNNCFAIVIGTFVVTSETNLADVFTTLCGVRSGDFIFREDGGIWALGNASAAVNTSIRVNVHPGPFCDWLAGDDALNWAYFDTTAITNAQAGNNVCHGYFLL
jgi:hypothetical protein